MSLPTKVDFIKDRFDPFTEIYSPLNISDEEHTIPAASPFYIRTKETIKEDTPSSIEIWTGAGKTGTQYTEVSSAPGPGEFQVDYKFQSGYIRFNEANGNTGIYITYKGLADVIQASHINTVQVLDNLDGQVRTSQVKIGTGSSINMVNAITIFSMHDYSFYPNLHCDQTVGVAAMRSYVSGGLAGDDTVGRMTLSITSGTHDAYWKYITASGSPEIWVVRDKSKKLLTLWEADDPAPGGKPPIECFDKDGNKTGKTFLIVPPKNYAKMKAQCEKDLIEKKLGAKSIGKVLLEEWEIDEQSRPKRPAGLAAEIEYKEIKKQTIK